MAIITPSPSFLRVVYPTEPSLHCVSYLHNALCKKRPSIRPRLKVTTINRFHCHTANYIYPSAKQKLLCIMKVQLSFTVNIHCTYMWCFKTKTNNDVCIAPHLEILLLPQILALVSGQFFKRITSSTSPRYSYTSSYHSLIYFMEPFILIR